MPPEEGLAEKRQGETESSGHCRGFESGHPESKYLEFYSHVSQEVPFLMCVNRSEWQPKDLGHRARSKSKAESLADREAEVASALPQHLTPLPGVLRLNLPGMMGSRIVLLSKLLVCAPWRCKVPDQQDFRGNY